MIRIEPTELVPKPLLWLVSVPCMIVLSPIGILYCLFCLAMSIHYKIPFREYKHDIPYSIVRPGFYVGLVISLLICRIIFIPRIIAMKREEKKEKEHLQAKRLLCEEWLNQFPFVDSMNRRVQLYISKGEAVGRVVVREVTEDEAILIETKRCDLPERIHLEINKVSF